MNDFDFSISQQKALGKCWTWCTYCIRTNKLTLTFIVCSHMISAIIPMITGTYKGIGVRTLNSTSRSGWELWRPDTNNQYLWFITFTHLSTMFRNFVAAWFRIDHFYDFQVKEKDIDALPANHLRFKRVWYICIPGLHVFNITSDKRLVLEFSRQSNYM